MRRMFGWTMSQPALASLPESERLVGETRDTVVFVLAPDKGPGLGDPQVNGPLARSHNTTLSMWIQ